MATVALVAENEPIAAAHVAYARFRCGQAFDDFLELAHLVQLFNLLGPTHVPPANKNPRQGQLSLTEDLLQLG